MVIAQNSIRSHTVQDSKNVNPHQQWHRLQLRAALLKRWWHIKAYGTILGIMLLTLVSLVFLRTYWSCRQLPLLISGLRHR